MKKSFTFIIDIEHLSSVSDEYLAAQWCSAQFLPAEYGDRDASEVVRAIGVEIIKRWMQARPVPIYNIQSHDYWRDQLSRFACWNGGEWVERALVEQSHAPAESQLERE